MLTLAPLSSHLKVPGLYVPLMALIDYRGFRLIATSVVPIGKDTLVYGSADAAKTIHNDVPEFEEKMAHAAQALNIKHHAVGSGAQMKMLYGPADIEGEAAKRQK